jgi:hypothetical protein
LGASGNCLAAGFDGNAYAHGSIANHTGDELIIAGPQACDDKAAIARGAGAAARAFDANVGAGQAIAGFGVFDSPSNGVKRLSGGSQGD